MLRGKRLSAAAALRGVGIAELELTAQQVFVIVELSSLQVNGAFHVHDDPNILDLVHLSILHDVGVLDLVGVLDGSTFQPLRGKARACNRRSATEGFKLRVYNDVVLDLDLQLHDVAAFRGAHDAGTDRLVVLRQAAEVPRIIIVVNHLITVSHGLSSLTLPRFLFYTIPLFNGRPIAPISGQYLLSPFHRAETSHAAGLPLRPYSWRCSRLLRRCSDGHDRIESRSAL